jgi:hypothetical protein
VARRCKWNWQSTRRCSARSLAHRESDNARGGAPLTAVYVCGGPTDMGAGFDGFKAPLCQEANCSRQATSVLYLDVVRFCHGLSDCCTARFAGHNSLYGEYP